MKQEKEKKDDDAHDDQVKSCQSSLNLFSLESEEPDEDV